MIKMFVVKEVAQARYDICKQCEHFNKIMYTCNQCGCFMKAKVKMTQATCPISKW